MHDAGAAPAAASHGVVRIGVDVREWRSGTSTGIARVAEGFVRWAAHHTAHELVLFGNQHTEFRVTGERIETRAAHEGNRLLWDQRTLPELLGEACADVLLSPYYKGPLRSPCPVVVTVNDLIDLHFPRGNPAKRLLLPWWMRTTARNAAHVLTLSEFSRRDIVARLGIDESRVSAFPPAVHERFLLPLSQEALSDARARYGLQGDYVLYVGRCAPHKNVNLLLRAWRGLPAPVRRRHALVLAGSDTHLFRDAAARNGIEVVTPGLVADSDLPALYAGATLLCFPSLYEGFGLPPLEAMACGTAVVAADATSIPEVVGDAAELVDPVDEDAWRAAIARLLADDEARARMTVKGAARARQFTLARSASAMLECLIAVTSGRVR